jgi:hypothetical protein
LVSQMRGKKTQALMCPHILFPQFIFLNLMISKVQEELGFEESKRSLSSESKDTVDNNAGLNAGHLPPIERKSDSETELPFKFPPTEGTSTEGTSMHSPLYSPGRLQSSSSEEATLDVKQEPTSGQGISDYDLILTIHLTFATLNFTRKARYLSPRLHLIPKLLQ